MNKIKSIFRYFMKKPLQMKLLFVLTFIIYGAIISSISYSILHHYQAELTKTRLVETQRENFISKSNTLKNILKKNEHELIGIKNSSIFKSFVETKNKDKNIVDLFSLMISHNRNLSQLRFINSNGDEVIRFERKKINSDVYEIEEKNLQNKKNRYYFKNIKDYDKNKIWYSNIDLNREHGEIQFPIVPTLRIGTAIYSQKGFEGILIMNIFFKEILKEYTKSPFFYVSIFDRDGEFIYHRHLNRHGVEDDYSWSRYLDKDVNLDIHYKKIEEANIFSNKKEYIFIKSLKDIVPNTEGLSVFYEPKIDELKKIEENEQNYIVTVTLIVLLLSIPLSLIISIIPNMLNDELFETKKILEEEMDTIDEYIYLSIANKDGVILDVSNAYTKLTGYNKSELIGNKHNILRHPDTKLDTYIDLWKTILSKKVWEGEICNLKKDGTPFYTKVLIRPNLDKNGEIDTFVAYVQDITYQKEIEKLSVTDELTKLYNRREFDKLFKSYISHSKRYKHSFTMLILDIDFFKQYNDTYGHLKGDIALKKVAHQIKDITHRNADMAFRIGGEEFSVLFSANSLDDAKRFSLMLKDEIENLRIEHKKSEVSEYLTVSVGLFHLDDLMNLSEDEIFNSCDEALYVAKKSGRNRISIATV